MYEELMVWNSSTIFLEFLPNFSLNSFDLLHCSRLFSQSLFVSQNKTFSLSLRCGLTPYRVARIGRAVPE